jgi:hypothetical protein
MATRRGYGCGVLPRLLVVASAAIIASLGAMHMAITFSGRKLYPRDDALKARLEEVTLVITRETTMWRAWIGFNASHAMGALLYAAIYAYLAWFHGALLFGSPFLLATGGVFLAGYVFLGRRYWFSVPFRGIVLATLAYAAGVAASLA